MRCLCGGGLRRGGRVSSPTLCCLSLGPKRRAGSAASPGFSWAAVLYAQEGVQRYRALKCLKLCRALCAAAPILSLPLAPPKCSSHPLTLQLPS